MICTGCSIFGEILAIRTRAVATIDVAPPTGRKFQPLLLALLKTLEEQLCDSGYRATLTDLYFSSRPIRWFGLYCVTTDKAADPKPAGSVQNKIRQAVTQRGG